MAIRPAAGPLGPVAIQSELTVTPERELSRLWGIPLIGIFARWILAIPHLVVLWLSGCA